jgi:hypothetical protein
VEKHVLESVGHLWVVLAQGRAVRQEFEPEAIMVTLIVIGVISVATVWFLDRKKTRKLRERELAAFQQRSKMEEAQKEREGRAYNQHVALNDLTAKKLELETRVLHAQLEAAEREKRARELHEEYHRLVVDKTSLEIQSLKLHIREQKKRMDDFTSYDDE